MSTATATAPRRTSPPQCAPDEPGVDVPSDDTAFEVVLSDGSRERVEGADAYQQEQSMTTFFRSDGRRQSVDCWSVRVASYRTDHVIAVRRIERSGGDLRHLRPV